MESFNDNPNLQIIIPPCNHPCSLNVLNNLINNNSSCPICRDKTFIGIDTLDTLDTLELNRAFSKSDNTEHKSIYKRLSSNYLARSASLAPCIPEYDEIFKEKGHFNNIPSRNSSIHMILRKKYLNKKSITDVKEIEFFSTIKLPIYILTLTQKSNKTDYNDLVVCILEKNIENNVYELINNNIVNFNFKNLTYKSLKINHSSDPSDNYLPNYGGYCKGPNRENILDHRVLISSDNDNIKNIHIHNLDIPYNGIEEISSNKNHSQFVNEEFLKISNKLELKENSNILILISQITYNNKTLRELSIPNNLKHVSIQPSCSVLTTTINDEKELKIAPWKLDETYMNTYLAIELEHL